MKTAMQKLIEYADSLHGSGHEFWFINSKIKDKARELTQEEKNQIIRAYNSKNEDRESELDPHKFQNGEDYFTKTYK